MERSVKTSLPSPKFNKCERVPSKKYFGSCDLSFRTNVSSEIPLSIAATNTKRLGIAQKEVPKKFYKTEIQRQLPKRTPCEKTNMNQHIVNAHLVNKLSKLSTPEDIAAWKDERRKRYPTVANVLLKQKVVEQKNKRGELLESNARRFGKNHYRKQARNIDTRNYSNRYVVRKNRECLRKYNRHLNSEGKACKAKSPNTVELKVKSVNCTHINSKIHSPKSIQYTENFNKTTEVNALSCLSNLYGSSDNSELETEPECNNTNHYQSNDEEAEKLLIQNKFDRADKSLELASAKNRERYNSPISIEKNLLIDEAPEELPIAHELKDDTTVIAHSNSKAVTKITPHQLQYKPQWTRSIQSAKLILHKQRAHFRKQNTILEKLLEPMQRHERNVLLQCVRFVCANKFFNKCT